MIPNRLAHEASPYLRQHANNPVDWHPWSAGSLARARLEDRPIFLSVGYSACHWCHVMEHESFENTEIALVLNTHFVSIKVDREERPDVDHLYMTALLLLNRGQGGWPMSVFLTPDMRPFYAGTYFPPTDRDGHTGFIRLVTTLGEWWRTRRADIEQQANDLATAVRQRLLPDLVPPRKTAAAFPETRLLEAAAANLKKTNDPVHGGFGSAPKFPHPMDLRLLFRLSDRFADRSLSAMAVHSLRMMARGGIHDHLGGGFARYSTDNQWLVPHFEKMLYDNGLLAMAYLEGWQVSGDASLRQAALGIFNWLSREMTHPQGGLYSALDADSEGVEGKYYVWALTEIREVLGIEAGDRFARVYGCHEYGNWEGANIPNLPRPLADAARREGMDEITLLAEMDKCRSLLLARRETRVRPGLDDKVLASWNALAVGSLAMGARVLGLPDLAEKAVAAAHFVLTHMRGEGGRLFRAWSAHSGPRLLAYLEDHACWIDALVELFQTTGDSRWVDEALELSEAMRYFFLDGTSGVFFSTGSDHEALLCRSIDSQDAATPSGNGAAALGLARLAEVTGRNDLRELALGVVNWHETWMDQHPLASGQMLLALDWLSGPVESCVITGHSPPGPGRLFLPRGLVVMYPPQPNPHPVSLLEGKPSTSESEPMLFHCLGKSCADPVVGAKAVAVWLAERIIRQGNQA